MANSKFMEAMSISMNFRCKFAFFNKAFIFTSSDAYSMFSIHSKSWNAVSYLPKSVQNVARNNNTSSLVEDNELNSGLSIISVHNITSSYFLSFNACSGFLKNLITNTLKIITYTIFTYTKTFFCLYLLWNIFWTSKSRKHWIYRIRCNITFDEKLIWHK